MSGFALFSLFFGAGNLILPPFLGVKSGEEWLWVVLGFSVTAVMIPILGILAHSKVQGTLFDLAKPVSPLFSSIYCVFIYVIAITIPSPRTASVTHEMSIEPFFDFNSIWTSSIYFLLVFFFVMNRSKILSFIGKMLTPIIAVILLLIIAVAIFNESTTTPTTLYNPFFKGFIEGYQTFDAIGGVVVGAVIIVSLNLRGYTSYQEKRELITKSGFIAGAGLLLIYGGLIFSGAFLSQNFLEDATRIEVLTQLSKITLGSFGTSFLSVLVALACFTTAVGIVTGASDYAKEVFKKSEKAYVVTAAISCFLGALIGHFKVQFIIEFAIPALMFIYPITIVLILLNVIPKKWAKPVVFKWVVLATFVFSIPDFLQVFNSKDLLVIIKDFIPFSKNNLGWVLPALGTFILINIYKTQQIHKLYK